MQACATLRTAVDRDRRVVAVERELAPSAPREPRDRRPAREQRRRRGYGEPGASEPRGLAARGGRRLTAAAAAAEEQRRLSRGENRKQRHMYVSMRDEGDRDLAEAEVGGQFAGLPPP